MNIFPAGARSGRIQLMGPPERFDELKQIAVTSPDGLDNPKYPPSRLAANADEARARMFQLEGSTYVPPVFAWKHPVAVTSIAFVTDSVMGDSSANTAWSGTWPVRPSHPMRHLTNGAATSSRPVVCRRLACRETGPLGLRAVQPRVGALALRLLGAHPRRHQGDHRHP
ncbi:MAG: hypothetical protein WKH68_11125, partial [Candidatus Limnocylindria bacterium]